MGKRTTETKKGARSHVDKSIYIDSRPNYALTSHRTPNTPTHQPIIPRETFVLSRNGMEKYDANKARIMHVTLRERKKGDRSCLLCHSIYQPSAMNVTRDVNGEKFKHIKDKDYTLCLTNKLNLNLSVRMQVDYSHNSQKSQHCDAQKSTP